MESDASGSIVVVDDSALTRAWIAHVVIDSGMSVSVGNPTMPAPTAWTSADGVVIVERRLPQGGCALVRCLRAGGATAGILLIGDPDDPQLESDAREAGADRVVRWPCKAQELIDAIRAVAAIGHGRRHHQARTAELDGEMRAAAMIQAALLPARPDLPEPWALESAFLPARDVGGDMLEFVVVGPAVLAIVLADVSGKGIGAALLAAMAQTAIRGALLRGADPAASLAEANALLIDTLDRSGRFLTGFIARVNLISGRVDYADAGHGHVALLDARGHWAPIDTGGLPLGLMPDAEYPLGQMEIADGGLLAAYSDGLVECPGVDPAEAREDLLESLAHGVAAAQVVADAPVDDDRTLVVLGRNR